MARGYLFPDIAPTEYKRRPKLLQTRVEVPFGDPQVIVPHPFVKRFPLWHSTFLTISDVDALQAHFEDNGTTYFSFYDYWSTRTMPAQPIAPLPIRMTAISTIVAGQLAYTMPAKNLSGVVVYDNTNTTIVSPANYSIGDNAGTEGEAVLTFNSAGVMPAAGHTLYFRAATGRAKFTLWYTTQQFPDVYQEGDLWALESPLEFEEKIT